MIGSAQFLRIPDPVVVGALHAQQVMASRQQRVGDLGAVAVVDPVLVQAVDAVAVTDLGVAQVVERTHAQAQQSAGFGQFDPADVPCRACAGVILRADLHRQQPQWRLQGAVDDPRRVEHIHAGDAAERQPAIAAVPRPHRR